MKLPTTKILPNLQGSSTKEGLDNVVYDIQIKLIIFLVNNYNTEEFKELILISIETSNIFFNFTLLNL